MNRPSSACCLFALLLGLASAPTLAQAGKDLSWEYKDWHSSTEISGKGKKTCQASTGGDGDDFLVVSATPGGDISIHYREQTYRGTKPALAKTDAISFRLDDKKQSVFADALVTLDVDAEGIPVAIAGLPSGDSPAMVAAMRSATSVTVWRENPRTRKAAAVHKFSLAGFTANFLKLAEWCGFDPNQLKTP